MSITITIGFRPLDLFQDENIEVRRQQRSLRELNKLFADYSKAFKIPATDTNNELLKHWYDLSIANSINAAEAIYGTWQLPNSQNDTLCLIELLGVAIKDGAPESYDIVVYGATRRISDEFGDRLLTTLDLTDYQHGLDYQTVTDSWQLNLFGGQILYPLFDISRGWIYDTSGTFSPSQNIATVAGRISLKELRPAILLRTLFVECFKQINIDITGDFLTDARFDAMYLLPMEKAGPYKTVFSDGVFSAYNTSPTLVGNMDMGRQKVTGFDQLYDPSNSVDLNAQEYTAPYTGLYKFRFLAVTEIVYAEFELVDMILVANGIPKATVSNPAFTGDTLQAYFTVNLVAGDVVWIYLQGSNAQRYVELSPWAIFEAFDAPSVSTSIPVNMADVMPSVRVTDFLKACIDSFNLIFTPLNNRKIECESLDDWYARGATLDITSKADTSDYTFEKAEIPSELTFQHDQKDDIANEQYRAANDKDFALSTYVSPTDFTNGTLDIKTIFQAPVPDLVTRYNSTGQPIGFTELETVKAYDSDLKPVQIPMLLFYFAGLQGVTDPFYLGNNLQAPTATLQNAWPYCRCYSERPATQSSLSVAFSIEPVLDEVNESAPFNTLINVYWSNYLRNTYDKQNRLLTIDIRYDDEIPSELPLNTRILYNNQQYIILELAYSTATRKYTFLLERYSPVLQLAYELLRSNGNSIYVNGLNTNTNPALLGFSSYQSNYMRYLKPLKGTTPFLPPLPPELMRAYLALNSAPLAYAINPLNNVNSWVTVGLNINSPAAITGGNLVISIAGNYRVAALMSVEKTSAGKEVAFQLSVNNMLITPIAKISANGKSQVMLESLVSLVDGDVIRLTAIKTAGGGTVNITVEYQQIILERIC